MNGDKTMEAKRTFSPREAQGIADALGLDIAGEPFDLEQFCMGLDVELEHGRRDPATNVTDDDPR